MTNEEILNAIAEMSVLELSELVKAIEDKFGVSAAAPVAVAAAPAAAPAPVAVGDGTPVKAPMPGTVLSVNVSQGQAVNEGDVLFVLEAMKMENEIVAPCSGTVSQVAASKGSSVATDDVLAVIG